jgi:hypothetical protein
VLEWSVTATDASIIDMNAELANRIPLVNACTTVEDVNVVYWDAKAAIDLLYVNDPAKQALYDAKVAARNALWDYANFTDDFIALVNVYQDFWSTCDYYVAEIDVATTLAAVDNLRIDGINAMKIVEILDVPQVDNFRSLVISVIEDEFMSIATPTEAQITIYNNAVNTVVATAHPYDMQMIYDQYLIDLYA